MRCVIGWVAVSFLILSQGSVVAQGLTTSTSAGLSLQQLSDEDLDAIQEETGHRVGVLVTAVKPGSPAAAAGLRTGDVLFTVAKSGVDSPLAVETALRGATGAIVVLGVRQNEDGQWEPVQVQMVLSARPGPAPGSGPTPAPVPAPANEEEVRQKLKALEDARAAGILSEEEYARKRDEILAKRKPAAPEIDEATRQKLDALDKARAAGILSDEEFEKKKAELLGAAGGRNAGSGGAGSALVPAQEGSTYRHVIGFRFWYPKSWTLKEHSDVLQLVPTGAAGTSENPEELYFVTGEKVEEEGIRDPADPRVLEYLDTQVRSFSPTLSRVGEPRRVGTAKGGGISLDWKGRNPAGEPVLARVYVNIINGYGVSLVAVGIERHVTKRAPDLESMFVSFGFGQGQNDPAVMGDWHLVSTCSITNNSPFETAWTRAQAVSETKVTLTLSRDGTWVRVEDYHAILLGGGVSLEDKQRTVERGTWNAGDGVLCLVGEKDTWEEYRYRVEGNRLRLVRGNRGEVWQR